MGIATSSSTCSIHSATPPKSHKRDVGGVESIFDEGLEAVAARDDFGLFAVVPAAPGESTIERAFLLLGLGEAVPFCVSSSGNTAADVEATGGVEAPEMLAGESSTFSTAARLPTSNETGF